MFVCVVCVAVVLLMCVVGVFVVVCCVWLRACAHLLAVCCRVVIVLSWYC